MTDAGTREAIDGPISQLFNEFADAIYTLGYRIVGDSHLAEDVVEEALIRVINPLATYRGEGLIGLGLSHRLPRSNRRCPPKARGSDRSDHVRGGVSRIKDM